MYCLVLLFALRVSASFHRKEHIVKYLSRNKVIMTLSMFVNNVNTQTFSFYSHIRSTRHD